jgi:DNA-binding XRE family transcriptional regulator
MEKNLFRQKVKENRKRLIKVLGYSPSTIHSWENGLRYPRLETALKLEKILGLNLDDIPYFQFYRRDV